MPGTHSITFLAAACAGWLMLTATASHAGDKPFVEVRYDVDASLDGCPDLADFRSMVAQRLGYDPYREGAERVVEVRARRKEQGLEGSLRWNSTANAQPGERHFVPKGQDCHELMSALAFMVAVQLELAANGGEGAQSSGDPSAPSVDESSPPPPPPEPPSASATAAAPEPAQPSAAPASAMTFVGAGPSVAVAMAPNTIALGRLFAAAEFERAAIELAAEASWPTTTRQDRGGGFRHQLVLGSLAACGRHRALQLCALAKLGILRAQGLGVDKAASPTGFVAQTGPRAAYVLKISQHVAFLAHVDGLFLLTPWTVYVNHAGIWTMPRFAAAAGFDLAIAFR